jgi:hypothetical protein
MIATIILLATSSFHLVAAFDMKSLRKIVKTMDSKMASPLENIASAQIVSVSLSEVLRTELINENIIFINGNHSIEWITMIFLYGVFDNIVFTPSKTNSIKKFDQFQKYYELRTTIRRILFFILIITTKNVQNAI